ncbi:hypothetical protein H6G89_32530 [Oscillatoria sp. FACHB-1407]|uniref:NB-ARC domain-containing protein n=1 Tax=Oscillatoria sp. FACHB-1407 TaxID=2692847 RepID=UPI0016827C04|nr:NB-ARC domain-containing protein [Oscillatoria sp. FACHB-1407]MBD2465716.1 hypothetical protein [Oscillatoria sp. FACHB-1407]
MTSERESHNDSMMQQTNQDAAKGWQTRVEGGTANIAETIVQNFVAARPSVGKPFQALPLPKDYIDRPDVRQAIKALLVNAAPIAGTLVVSAIYGLGGIGKSVLASALAHDAEIQARFSDGVLWATLGQNPDLLSFLFNWIQSLGDRDYKPTTPEAASEHLRTLLYDKNMLLVVDDAWNPEHVEPFRVGGTGCWVLVTTREAQIPDAERYDMDVMSAVEAVELLLKKAQCLEPTIQEREQANWLAREVGYLPLALELSGAQIADGISWEELLEDLQAEVARLETLDLPNSQGVRDEKTRKRLSLTASFNLSLKQLSPEQLQQFAWLGVLPEDVSILPEVAATLWQVAPRQASAILRTFRAKALLLSGLQQAGQKATYRLHDLMHDLARGLLTGSGTTELPGLGLTFPEAHRLLLERYQAKTQGGKWHTLPNDGYIHAYLTWHFEQAQQVDALHEFLQEEDAQGRNGWYEACDKLGQTANFVTDVARAWMLAEAMYQKNRTQSIALQCRYALSMTSLNSLAKNISPELMANLVEHSVWTPLQGLAYALQIPSQAQRASAIQQLAPKLPEELLPKVLEAARSIENAQYRFKALVALASYKPEVWSEVLEAARSIENAQYRSEALVALASYKPEVWSDKPEVWSEVLEAARSVEDCHYHYRSKALVALIPKLSEESLPEALEVARSINDADYRSKALVALIPKLSEESLPEVLEVARSIENARYRSEALVALILKLSEESLLKALEVARSIEDAYYSPNYRSEALVALIPKLSEESLPEALEVARSINDADYRSKALVALIPKLSEESLPEALEVARSIGNTRYRSEALVALILKLSEESLLKALEVARSIEDAYYGPNYRSKALVALIPKLLEESLPEALEVARSIENADYRSEALVALIPKLLEESLPEALEVARSIENTRYRSKALVALIPQLPEELLPKALEAARSIKDAQNRSQALGALAQHRPEVWSEVLEVACSINDADYRSRPLVALIPKLSEELLPKVLEVARSIEDDHYRFETLVALIPKLPKEFLPKALEVARSIENTQYRFQALTALAAYMPKPQLELLLQEALLQVLESSRAIRDDSDRTVALGQLTPFLPKHLLREEFGIVNQIENLGLRAKILCNLITKLPTLQPDALKTINTIHDKSDRVAALIELLPHSPQLLSDILKEVHATEDSFQRALALSKLVPFKPEILSEVLGSARSIRAVGQIKILSNLIPYRPALLQEALKAAREVLDNHVRSNVMSSLVPYAPEILSEVLETIHAIPGDVPRAYALGTLVAQCNLGSQNYDFWKEILHTLANRDRQDLLRNIPNLSRAIFELGGEEAIAGVFQAIQQVCRWWR